MRFLFLAAFLFIAAGLSSAHAGMPEAREVARINNCSPKKIEIYQQQLGSFGKTVYRVECNIPKVADTNTNANAPTALLIGCDQNMCDLLRPVTIEKK